VTHFWNFGTPLISRERLKLETSNLARRRRAVSSNERKCKIASKGVMWGSRDQILEFWDPHNISLTVGATKTLNLAQRRTSVTSNEKKCKIGSKGVMWGSPDPLLEFRDPPNISGTVKARNFKLGMETEGGEF